MGKKQTQIRKSFIQGVTGILLVTLLFGSVSLSVFASKETEEKIKKAKEEREETQQEINQNEANLQSLTSTRSGLQYELNNLNAELAQIGENLEKLEGDIADKTKEIEVTTGELNDAIKREEDQYASMKKRVQFMYEKSRTFYLDMFFGIHDFSDYLNRQDYAEQISAYDRGMLDEYIATKKEIDRKKEKLEEEINKGSKAQAVVTEMVYAGTIFVIDGSGYRAESDRRTYDKLTYKADALRENVVVMEG